MITSVKNYSAAFCGFCMVLLFFVAGCDADCTECKFKANAGGDCLNNTNYQPYKDCELLLHREYSFGTCECKCVTGWTGQNCDQPTSPVTCPGTVTDVDNNVYDVIKIGNQCWMKQNLKTTRYRDGSAILTGLNNSTWESTEYGAYAIFNDNLNNDSIYGKLYNFNAVSSQKLCPDGWHIPSAAEWQLLLNTAGDDAESYKSTLGWTTGSGTNTTEFTILPGSIRLSDGTYGSTGFNLGEYAGFWSRTSSPGQEDDFAKQMYIIKGDSYVQISDALKNAGLSCRCVKD